MKSTLLASLVVSASLMGCGVAAEDGAASNESAVTPEPDVVRGCATFDADGTSMLCLDRTEGHEEMTVLRSGSIELDHALATRRIRTVSNNEIPSPSEIFTSSLQWEEVTYRTGLLNVTVYTGLDHGWRWPVIIRGLGDDSEAFAENIAYSDVIGVKGCADLASARPFGPPSAGRLCTENESEDSAVVSLQVGTNTVLDKVTMSRRASVGEPEAFCIDPIPLAHVCQAVTAKRTVDFQTPKSTISVTSYISDSAFPVSLTVGNDHYVLRPSFTP